MSLHSMPSPYAFFVGVLTTGVVFTALGATQVTSRLAKSSNGNGPTLTSQQSDILGHFSLVMLPDGQGNFTRTIRISGVNVQIVNGLGATNGYPGDPDSKDPAVTLTNGVGNLIVGYNELGNPFGDHRTGSHNVVVGHGLTYQSFGGIVCAQDNAITGAYASVTGGFLNKASGELASVSAGRINEASGRWSSVSGGGAPFGFGNIASGLLSSVSGGGFNHASGVLSAVSGGQLHTASGDVSSVSGGFGNTASGANASVSGGENNVADAEASSASGGLGRTVSAANMSGDTSYDWIAGSLWEDD